VHPYPKDAPVNPVLQPTDPRTVIDAPKKARRRPLGQMTGQDASAQRALAARVLAENPADRLAVAGFNSSI
jgi:FXSXX-COOH protein